MKKLVFVFVLLIPLSGWASKDCEAKLAQVQFMLEEEHSAELSANEIHERQMQPDQMTAPNVEEEVDYLVGLVVPQMYLDNRAAYEAAKKRVREDIMHRLEIIKIAFMDVGGDMSFREKLEWLAGKWDTYPDPVDKAAVMAKVMSMFSIPNEIHYMQVIVSSPSSDAFKWALYERLKKIFKMDPSWRGPLENAMKQGGLK